MDHIAVHRHHPLNSVAPIWLRPSFDALNIAEEVKMYTKS